MDQETQRSQQPQEAPVVPETNVTQPAAQSIYNGYDLTAPAPTPEDAVPVQEAPAMLNAVQWDASEYIHHQKGFGWYLVLGFIVLVLTGLSIWAQNWTFAVLTIVMGIATAVYAGRSPGQVHYALTAQGLQIDQKHYNYSDFRAFGILPDGGLFSIVLIPTKRFMPAITIYFAEQDGERIVDVLGASLPMEKLDHDPIDKLMRRLHF
jgi:hypothetical protein